ncbi:MAG: hypothetical protein AAGC60_19045 [Acidobacteriota bacterium]
MSRWLLGPALALALGVLALGLTAASVTAQETDDGAQAAEDPTASVPGALRVSLEPTEVTIGGRVRATLTLVWMGEELDAPPRFPAFGDGWGGAEVLETSELEAFTDNVGRQIFRQVFELAAFRPGRVDLPAPRVAVPLAERTVDVTAQTSADQPLGFEVVSVLPEIADPVLDPDAASGDSAGDSPDDAAAADQAPAPRPLAPPARFEPGLAFPLTAVALLLLLAFSVWRLLVALARAPALSDAPDAAPVDPLSLLPPLDELRRRLAAIEPDRPEPAHTAISLALRTYLGRRLTLQAVESTTTEIQRRLRTGSLDPDTARRAVELLRLCDRAKFAGERVPVETTARRVEDASSIGSAIDGMLRRDESTQVAGLPQDGPREAAA